MTAMEKRNGGESVSMINAISDGFNVLAEDEGRGFRGDGQNVQHQGSVQLPPEYPSTWKDTSQVSYTSNGGMQYGMHTVWNNGFEKKDANSQMFRMDNGSSISQNNIPQPVLNMKNENDLSVQEFTKIKDFNDASAKEYQQWPRQFDNNYNVMNHSNGNSLKPSLPNSHSTTTSTFPVQDPINSSPEQKNVGSYTAPYVHIKHENPSNLNHCNGDQKGQSWPGNRVDTKLHVTSADSYSMQREIYLRDSYSVIPQTCASPVAVKREHGDDKNDCYQSSMAKYPRTDVTASTLIENGETSPPPGAQKMISLQPVKLEPTLLSIPGDHNMNMNQHYPGHVPYKYNDKPGSYNGTRVDGVYGHGMEEPERNCLGKSVSASLMSLHDFAYAWNPGNEPYSQAMVGYRATINHPSLSMELNNPVVVSTYSDNTQITPNMITKNCDTTINYPKPAGNSLDESLCSNENYATLCNLDQSTSSSFQSNDGFDSSNYSVGNSVQNDADMDDSFGKPFRSVESEYNQEENGEEDSCQKLMCRCGICGDTFDTSISLRAHVRMHTESIALQCEICNKKFKNKVELRTHCENHDEEKVLACDVCDKTFEKKRCLKSHLRTHSGEKKKLHKCEVCGRQYGTLQGYLVHKDSHGIDTPHECSTCGKIFGHEDLLSFHMKTHTDIFTFMCHVCDKKFGNNRELQKHLSKHTGLMPFQCSICNDAFSDDYTLQMHISEHTGEAFHICEVCGKSYKDIQAMKEHQKTHSEEKPFICEICCKGFKSKTNLHEHYRIHSGEKPFECHVCGKRFRQSSILRNHVRIHTGETPWECKECGKKFSFKGNYTRHLWSHTEEKERTCRVCGKIFTDMIGLKQHLERHTRQSNQKPKSFKCNICDSEFDRSRTLQMHMKVHTGDCPFTCDICEKTFVSKIDLNKHVKLHDDEKSFRCDVCDKSYVDNGRLRRHMKIHMGLKPFKCDVCSSTFTEKYHLTKHQKTHQRDADEK